MLLLVCFRNAVHKTHLRQICLLMVKGLKLFMACKEQLALPLPHKIIIQKLVLKP